MSWLVISYIVCGFLAYGLTKGLMIRGDEQMGESPVLTEGIAIGAGLVGYLGLFAAIITNLICTRTLNFRLTHRRSS